MKKILISCDEYVFCLDGQYYLSEFGHILVHRYLSVFDKLLFVARTRFVYSIEELGKNKFKIQEDKIEVLPIPFFQGPKEYLENYWKIRIKLKRVVDDCDAAILRLPSTLGFACLNPVINSKIPYGIEVVANPYEIKQKSKNLIIKILMARWDNQLKKACRLAAGVSYVTEASLQKLYPTAHKSYNTNYSSIEMDISFYKAPREIENNKEIKISHVSNHIKTYNKGHLTVILIVKLLKEKGYEVSAKFAGEGEYIALFKNKAKKLGVLEQIEFVGSLNKTELVNFLNDSNIMIFPSTTEGLPRVLIEAMAVGLPCLSTNVGGIPELLDDDLLFHPDDVKSFAKKIVDIFSKDELYSQLSRQNYKKALEYEKNRLDEKRNKFYKYLYKG